MEKEIKKCPFCGGEAEIVEDKNHISFIRCKRLCCRTYFCGSPKVAIKAWNSRSGRMKIVMTFMTSLQSWLLRM